MIKSLFMVFLFVLLPGCSFTLQTGEVFSCPQWALELLEKKKNGNEGTSTVENSAQSSNSSSYFLGAITGGEQFVPPNTP